MKNCVSKSILATLTVALLTLPLAAQEEEKPVVASELAALSKTCELLAEDPRDEAALTSLLAYAKNTNGIDRLRSRAMAGYALSSLFKGDTNLYVRARLSHLRTFPDDGHLLKIDLRTCYVSCANCQGRGSITSICPDCGGSDKCKACKGVGEQLQRKNLRGSHEAGIKCAVCGGTGRCVCSTCSGRGKIVSQCPKCKGSPEHFAMPTKVYDDFILLMKGISKWISNEDLFSQQLLAAKSKEGIDERVAALRELLANYSYREDKGVIEKLLGADLAVLAEHTKTAAGLQEREVRELAVLRNLINTPNPAAARATLCEYLEGHPDSTHRLELQSIVNHLTAELERRSIKRRNFYVLGGIIALLLFASCIHINHYNYNIFSGHKDLPSGKNE